jgi:hypothetical protein
MAVRIFLGLSVLVWLPYGIFCLFQPEFLAEAAGVASLSATGTTELRAMYGGLQAALGVLAGAAFFRAELRRPALLTLVFLCAGLFLARLVGVALDSQVSAYTASGLGFELASAGFAGWLLSREAGGAGAPKSV